MPFRPLLCVRERAREYGTGISAMVSWRTVSLARLFIAETRNLYDKCASRVLSQLKRNPCLVDEPSCSDDVGLSGFGIMQATLAGQGQLLLRKGSSPGWLASWRGIKGTSVSRRVKHLQERANCTVMLRGRLGTLARDSKTSRKC